MLYLKMVREIERERDERERDERRRVKRRSNPKKRQRAGSKSATVMMISWGRPYLGSIGTAPLEDRRA